MNRDELDAALGNSDFDIDPVEANLSAIETYLDEINGQLIKLNTSISVGLFALVALGVAFGFGYLPVK